MSEIPREIADLCGIIDKKETVHTIGRPSLPPPLQITRGSKGDIWTVVYNLEEIGWITKITVPSRDGNKYRAVSAHGAFKHCSSLDLARSFIMAEYY